MTSPDRDRLLRRCAHISRKIAELKVAQPAPGIDRAVQECRLRMKQEIIARKLGEVLFQSARQHRQMKP